MGKLGIIVPNSEGVFFNFKQVDSCKTLRIVSDIR